MKVVFANPPVIRSENSNPENNFEIDGFIFKPWMRKIKGSHRFYGFLKKYFGVGKGVRYGVRAGSRWPWTMEVPHGGPHYPFFMGYAASYLKSKGHEVNILDAVEEEEYNYNNFLRKVINENPDLVILECSTPTIDIDIWFANLLSKYVDVALAGPHLNENTVSEIQKFNKNIKFYLLGEYILSSLDLADSLKPGIYKSKVVKDLDEIPFPFRDYISSVKYYDPTMPTPKPQLQIYGSKGCPFKCTFCMWPQVMYGGIVSLRKPEKIAEEINNAVEKYGFKSIFFDDDTFNIGNERISKLCDYLKNIGLPWTMMGRIDLSPDWLYEKMIDSGCVGMRFGIETFNIEVLKNIEKGIERKDFRKSLEFLCEKYPKLMIHITMMKNLPGQTEEDYKKDMEIITQLGFSEHNIYRSFQLSRCVPFPGTKLYEQVKNIIGEENVKKYHNYDGGQETIMEMMDK